MVDRAIGKVITELSAEFFADSQGLTTEELAQRTGYKESTVRTEISNLKNYHLRDSGFASDVAKRYQIKKGKDGRWKLELIGSRE